MAGQNSFKLAKATLIWATALACVAPCVAKDDDFIMDTDGIGKSNNGVVTSDQFLELGVPTANALRMEGEQSMRIGNLDRALSVWDGAADPASAIHMAALRSDVLTLNGRPCFDNPFLEDHREDADKIGAFLMRPEVDARLEDAFFTVTDPRLQKILSDAMVR